VLDTACAADPRTRKELGSLTPAEASAYQAAVLALHAKEAAPGDGLDWFEEFIRVHAEMAAEMHWTPHFLPWHRLFLLAFENALRKIDPTVTIPYCTFTLWGGWGWGRGSGALGGVACIWRTCQVLLSWGYVARTND